MWVLSSVSKYKIEGVGFKGISKHTTRVYIKTPVYIEHVFIHKHVFDIYTYLFLQFVYIV